MNEVIAQKLSELPSSPGVYLFRGRGGQILYVGKARSLRDRVRSYFQESRIESPKLDRLVEAIEDLEIVATDTEREALVLENNLVKTHKPRYNVLLRDDKNHPYLKLTLDEAYPRIYVVRRPGKKDGSVYAGPYVPASLARRSMNLVHRLFGIRNCNEKLDGHRARPCLQYQIKRCMAPCVESLAGSTEYKQAAASARLFLEGKNEDLVNSLKAQMYEASEDERFEEAARLRDAVRMLDDLGTRQKMASVRGEERDIFGFYREGDEAVLQVFSMRSGKVVDRDSFVLKELTAHGDEDLVSASLKQYYELGRYLPEEIHVPVAFPEQSLVAEWLSGKKGSRVEIVVPKRGGKRRLVDLVCRNARLAFELDSQEGRQVSARLESLREVLELAETPQRIEAFDISNIQASDIVASMVVFEQGYPKRSDYRKFKVRTVTGKPDDFASMHEVVLRRYRRVLEEGDELPDLVLVDGGKGQLGAAYEALAELGLTHLPLVSIAKKEELLHQVDRPDPVDLPRSSPTLHLVQRIRDEAHRFAITFHRKQRAARSMRSVLEDVPGIGPKKKKLLLTRFRSMRGIKEASEEELAAVLGPKLAERVHRQLAEMS